MNRIWPASLAVHAKERAPTSRSRQATLLTWTLAVVAVGSLPFMGAVVPAMPSFVAAFVGTTGILDLLTAMILFDLYRLEGRTVYLGVAGAYLFSALLIWIYGATFPGIMPSSARFSSEQSAGWLWLTWHFWFPCSIMWATLRSATDAKNSDERQDAVRITVVFYTVFVAVVALIATLGRDSLPGIVHHTTFTPLYGIVTALSALANCAAIIVLRIRTNSGSNIDVWLVTALFANLLDVALNAATPRRYTMPWYAGKVEMLVASGVVIFALMRSWTALYASSLRLTERLQAILKERINLQARFEREHTIAAELQQASLPRTLPELPYARLHAVYEPAVHDLEIGGDWYDAFVLENGILVLTLGDVAGKGLAASLVMGKVRQMLRIAALTDHDPCAMLDMADRALRSEHEDAIVTAFAATLDRESGELIWACAGHPPAMLRHADGRVELLDCISLPLGLRNADPSSARVRLSDGAMLVAYTDGLIEAGRDVIEGIDQVRAALNDAGIYEAPDPASALHRRIVAERARDDVAVVTLSYSATAKFITQRWTGHADDHAGNRDIRLEILDMLRAAGAVEEFLFNVELVFGELISNVVRYAGGRFESKLEIDGRHVALTIADEGRGFYYSGAVLVDPFAERGRGLFLISTLSTHFTVTRGRRRGSIARATFEMPAAEALVPA